MTQRSSPVRILVIDDDNAIRVSLSVLLTTKGYQVSLASDGVEGLAQFTEHAPQIVITDMVMPGQQGLETIPKVRALSPDVSIIAMSGSIQAGPTSALERARVAGANYCLEKPFETAELLGLLDEIVRARGL